jgi:hypothetical protein
MKRIKAVSILCIFMLSLAGSNTSFIEDDIKKLFLTHSISGIICDPETKRAYGISYTGEGKHFVSIDMGTGALKRLRKFPADMKIVTGASAVDKKNRRYFFWGKVNAVKYLYVIDMDTGETFRKHKPDTPFVLFQYDGGTGKIYALSRIDGTCCFIEFNVNSGKTRVLKELPNLSRIKGTVRRIDPLNRGFLFEGVLGNSDKNSLLTVSLKNGEIRTIKAFKVNIDEYRVHMFGKGQTVNTIYTAGVGNCVAVAGYCKSSNLGFLAHFSPNFKKIENALAKIEEEIKKNGGSGFADMTIRVVGGRMKKDGSYENALKIYRELIETYAVEYKGDRIYHLGKAYNIVINNGEIDIF